MIWDDFTKKKCWLLDILPKKKYHKEIFMVVFDCSREAENVWVGGKDFNFVIFFLHHLKLD